jgi:excisionase family DNA binding protein
MSRRPPERLMTSAEVAELFRVDPKTLTHWAVDGRLLYLRTPGGQYRFRESDMRELLRQGESAAG